MSTEGIVGRRVDIENISSNIKGDELVSLKSSCTGCLGGLVR